MTFNTDRYNVKPMPWGIAMPMVIILSLCGAVMALQAIGSGQFASSNGLPNSFAGTNFVRMTLYVASLCCFAFFCFGVFAGLNSSSYSTKLALRITPFCNLAFFALFIAFQYNFAFVCLVIVFLGFGEAYFAIVAKPILSTTVFVKFRDRLSFFAMGTSFCYDLLRHGFFLSKKSCLEPVAALTAVGSFYYIGNKVGVK